MQRNKGKRGEREAAEVLRLATGLDVRRRVRQHEGDSDLLGIDGWAIEVKVASRVTASVVNEWWLQAIKQAGNRAKPLLMYRQNRQPWRCRWRAHPAHPYWIEGEPEAWAVLEWGN